MLGANISLELSEMVLSEQRNPKETDKAMVSDSSKGCLQLNFNRNLKVESRQCFNFSIALPKKYDPHIWFKGKMEWGWFLTHEPKVTLWLWNRYFASQVWVKYINFIPNCARSTRFVMYHFQGSLCHWVLPNVEKKTLLHHLWKVEGSVESMEAPICETYRVLGYSSIGSVRHPLVKTEGGTSTCVPLTWA